MTNFENLNKFRFPGAGPYDIPPIAPVTDYPAGDFLPISDAMTEKSPAGKNLHCFVDDYRFARLWNTPDRYIPLLEKFRAVYAPDFSTYTDMPVAMQIYNHYRKHWCAAYWQLHGLTVYPTRLYAKKNKIEASPLGTSAGRSKAGSILRGGVAERTSVRFSDGRERFAALRKYAGGIF